MPNPLPREKKMFKDFIKELDLFDLQSADEPWTVIELTVKKWLLFHQDNGFLFTGSKPECYLYVSAIDPVNAENIRVVRCAESMV